MSLTERLKTETNPQHVEMRGNALIKAILSKKSSQEEIGDLYCFLYNFHRELEKRSKASDDPKVSATVTEDQLRSQMLEKDIEFLYEILPEGRVPLLDIFNLYGCYAFEEMLNSHGPYAILGASYVLEGAVANGGKILESRIGEAFGWDSKGTRYFQGHGEQTKQKWQEFKDRLDNLDLTTEESDITVDCAKKTYQLIKEWYETIRPE